MNSDISSIYTQLLELQDEAQSKILSRFFKTNPGEYGANDYFLGIKVPVTRSVIQSAPLCDIDDLEPLVTSKWHEIRLAGLLMLIRIYRKNYSHKALKNRQLINNKCYDYYLNHTQYINNWDLVDLTAPTIVGEWLFYLKSNNVDIMPELLKLASSTNLWEQRIAIIGSLYFVRKNDFNPTITIITKNLYHKHDLIQKANGWLLREIGKRNQEVEEAFLLKDKIYKSIPRTTLRYAIEKFEESKRLSYLKGTI